MKAFFLPLNSSVPQKVPVFIFNKLYSKPRLYIPKIKGTDKPDINKPWYVSFRYRNEKGILEKFIEKKGINRIKTIAERKKAGQNLCKAIHRLLQEGYNPIEARKQKLLEKTNFTIIEAFDLAYKERSKNWTDATKSSSSYQYRYFKNWLTDNKMAAMNIKDLKKRHIVIYLNELTDENARNAKTRNNHKLLISSLVSQLVHDDILEYNFVKDIPLLKSKANKNKPFTFEQLKSIKEYLQVNDPYLLQFMQFLTYSFLRNVEICRIRVKDVDLKNNRITVNTKTEENAVIFIVDPLRKILDTMELEKYSPDHFIFTPNKTPGEWLSGEKQRVSYFSKRFTKLKKAIGEDIGLAKEHSIYSCRHNAVLNLYNSKLKQGLTDLEAKHQLMPITRHKSLSGLENYLRNIGALLPKDYSKEFSLDF